MCFSSMQKGHNIAQLQNKPSYTSYKHNIS